MNIAILGATGAVGRTMLRVLAERKLPVDRLTLLASSRSEGKRIEWEGREYQVHAPEPGCFEDVDLALFSAGADRSREWGPRAAEEGAVVVDNSSAWRMDPQVPLVVPEVNAEAMHDRPRGIIANPNCSTIQVVVPLKALRDAAGLKRLVMTTFQAVSGAGETGSETLRRELAGEPLEHSPFSRQIAGNAVPQIGDFDAEGWTAEERKMIHEPRKILSLPDLPIAPTCVRVPVAMGHSVEVMVELEGDLSVDEAIRAMEATPGVVVSRSAAAFPTAHETAGRDEVFVGRVRADPDLPRVLHFWVVADNLRKGAATNAVQIAERLIRE
jgi:aspartate-semialdehyde dehydrogenase